MDLRFLTVVLGFAGAAPAQGQRVLPPSHALVEGTTSTNVPFGRSSPTRVQCVYDWLLFANPVQITALAFRADGGATAAQKQVDLEIAMTTMPLPLVGLGADFAGNRGTDFRIVLPRQLLTLPAASTTATPQPFLPPIVLASPFTYDPARGPLLIEIVVHGQPPGGYTLDATWVCDSPQALFGPPACTPAVGLPLRVESVTTQLLWGRPWTVRTFDGQPGALVTLVLGTRESGSYNGWTLPFDLLPLGAPGCHLSTDVAAAFFSTVLGDGTATFLFPIPNEPSFVGAWLRYQAGAVVPGANALGVITSQAKKVQICGYEPVARVWSSGLTATAGVREIGVAPVIEITWQ